MAAPVHGREDITIELAAPSAGHPIDGFIGHVRLHRTELSAQGVAGCAVVAGALLLHLSSTT